MKWLWLKLVAELTPAVLALIPGAAPLAPIVATAIQTAEALPGATGDQKRAHAQALVADGVAATNLVAGKTVIDPTLAADVASSTISTIVGVTNLVHAAHAPAGT